MNYTSCWLQYQRLSAANESEVAVYHELDGTVIEKAVKELSRAFRSLYNRSIHVAAGLDEYNRSGASILLQLDKVTDCASREKTGGEFSGKQSPEGYRLECTGGKCTISAASDAGLLYGVFALIRNLQLKQVTDYDFFSYSEEKAPYNPLRMLNHWDNIEGHIERGYSGRSFFFKDNELLISDRTEAYARMIASIGINGVVINNVNVRGMAPRLISDQYYDKLRSMLDLFASYGIKLFLSVDFAAPMDIGGLATADPCDDSVRGWWRDKAKEVWENLPGFGGFLVKADSEGRPGPYTYDRSQADGANTLAEAVRPYEGLIIWRCFVYDCQQDWRDLRMDRARAAYDNFMPLDGEFADNVILQIKNGPMDFQVREPVSPLFGGLKKTNMILEVQLAQEYTGQQRHVCYLIPWFKEILDFHTCCGKAQDTVAQIVSGRTYGSQNCGMAAVANTGNDANWTGHDLAAANLYGFGRLAFDTALAAEEIAEEWITQTFGADTRVHAAILKILMMSWPAYEKYTSPLGIGWMVKPGSHYGPDVDGYEYDKWGTYHKADHKALGVDRTANGTGYCSQYNEPLASVYADVKTCPEELILFFHRLEYNYVLSSGKTVLQHIYDTHFEGAEEAAQFLAMWKELEGLVEKEAYFRVEDRLKHQAAHAREWRDVINSYFYRKTGIPDAHGRLIF